MIVYGDKRDYSKIDIFYNGQYQGSTTWSKTCREAKQRFFYKYPTLDFSKIKCSFGVK